MNAAELIALLDIEPVGPDSYIGGSHDKGWKRVYGGQVVAQALVAAERSVENLTPHSLHAYFILAGDPSEPIAFDVERVRDGRSFATRRVVARQRGATIFFMSASFQRDEEGALDHAFAMPPAPAADEVADPFVASADAAPEQRARLQTFFERIHPIEFRPLDASRYRPGKPGHPVDPRQSLWIRIREALPDDAALHRAALAYLSDMTLIDTVLVAHGESISSGRFQTASLDHALWLHRPMRADEWLLYVQDSPSAHGGRGFARGLLFSASGSLVASVAQEGLFRRRSPAPSA